LQCTLYNQFIHVLHLLNQSMIFQLVDEEPVQHIGTVVVLSFWGIVCLTVCEHPLHVCNEQPLVDIVAGFQPFCHSFHVHRELDVLIVVWNCLTVYRDQEWP